MKEETIEDAVFAANLLRNDNRIDSNKIFVLGHSLDGMLEPRIDAEGGSFSGIIIMAGSPRSLSEIMLSQNEDLINQLNKLLQMIAAKQIASLNTKFSAISAMSDDEAKRKKVFAHIYVWYFKEMDQRSAIDYLRITQKPVLILQGEGETCF